MMMNATWMQDEPPTCRRCGEWYSVKYPDEPSVCCHDCAHVIVDELVALDIDVRRNICLAVKRLVNIASK